MAPIPMMIVNKLEKWFPLQGERASSLYFCMYIKSLEVLKQNRKEKEEETEQQTYQALILVYAKTSD